MPIVNNKYQVGNDPTVDNNFVIQVPSPADGTLEIRRGTLDNPGDVVLSISSNDTAVIPGAVGTVSQSGGVPTGAIIETGTNANGTYTKWADGTMICRKTVTYNGNINSPGGSIFTSSDISAGAWASTFSATPDRLLSCTLVSGTAVPWTAEAAGGTVSTTLAGSFRLLDYSSRTGLSINVNVVGIGRWF